MSFMFKYCPFCGVSQITEQPIVAPIEVNVETARTNVAEDHQDKNEAEPENNSALVSHITQKTNKELRGVIIMGGTLEQLKQYDRYAFKKQQGIFLRLKHLTLVPDHLLDADQLKLKYQHVQDGLFVAHRQNILLLLFLLSHLFLPIALL